MTNELILALIFMAFSYPINTQWFCYDAQFMASTFHFMRLSWDNHRLFTAFLSTSARCFGGEAPPSPPLDETLVGQGSVTMHFDYRPFLDFFVGGSGYESRVSYADNGTTVSPYILSVGAISISQSQELSQ